MRFVSSPHVKGHVGIWKWVLSYIEKNKEFEHVYKLVGYSTYRQLILDWNLIWAYMHDYLFMTIIMYTKLRRLYVESHIEPC